MNLEEINVSLRPLSTVEGLYREEWYDKKSHVSGVDMSPKNNSIEHAQLLGI